ncbi:MAG: tetratricopeptide repeat protein [Candidatus Margulisbacteria bacterium]|jgi:predicted Zn-dependent protease|nr:tetratricopeptide repeat protein [Candidatus Margulisiibacteriota bacterium]
MRKVLVLIGLLLAVASAAYDPLADILERQDYPRLMELSREAVISRESAHNYYYLAAAYTGFRRHRLAAKAYLLALDKPDLSYEMGGNIAAYFEARGDMETALTVCRQLFKKFPKERSPTSQKIISILTQQNRDQEIVEFFMAVLDEDDPRTNNPYAYYVGRGYYNLNNFGEAENYFQKALDAGCQEAELFLKQGELKVKKREWQTGIALINDGLQRAGVLYSPTPDTYKYLGQAYAGMENHSSAADNLRKAIAAGDRTEESYVQFAENALLGRDFQGILSVLEPRAEANSKNADYQYYLASACDNLNLRAQAIQYYQKALEARYKNADFVRMRISALRQQEEDEG